MGQDTVLVVDDEATVRDVVRRYLEHDGYAVRTATTGAEALAMIDASTPDLIVLDLMLPEVQGEEVCRRVRAKSDVPIIMLTARGREPERLLGLELGADDYLVKPFSPRELVARVKAVLRRSASEETSERKVVAAALEIDPVARTVTRDGDPVALTAKEFDLLYFLASHHGRVFTRDQLLERVWGWDYEGDSATVTVHIRRLRAKIEPDDQHPRHLQTVWSVGYKFNA